MALRNADVPLLKEKLDALARTYHDAYLATDPLGIAHAYRGARDREVAAFLSASLAFGNAARHTDERKAYHGAARPTAGRRAAPL